jgi:uncharacterized protein DUF6794
MYGRMKINQDKVPINLDDAVNTLKEGMDKDDIAEFKKETFHVGQLHFTLGMALRNEWSLWEKDTILVQWFKKEFGVDFGDDITGIILDCLYQDIIGKPRRAKELADRYIAHWKKQKDK